jgi:RNA polymerase sigma-70 factor (ECF subfamily)
MPLLVNDEQLPVAEARAGQTAAWDTLFHRYQLPLYTYVQKLTRHEQSSLDIVQETFIKAVRHINTLRDDARFGSWMFRIAHQQCQQHWRKLRPVESIEDSPGDEPVDSANNPLDELLAAEQEELFLAAIDALPEEHRSVVLLHCLEGFQLAEIADITGVPVGTVKSRLFNARKTLRTQLASKFKS